MASLRDANLERSSFAESSVNGPLLHRHRRPFHLRRQYRQNVGQKSLISHDSSMSHSRKAFSLFSNQLEKTAFLWIKYIKHSEVAQPIRYIPHLVMQQLSPPNRTKFGNKCFLKLILVVSLNTFLNELGASFVENLTVDQLAGRLRG